MQYSLSISVNVSLNSKLEVELGFGSNGVRYWYQTVSTTLYYAHSATPGGVA